MPSSSLLSSFPSPPSSLPLAPSGETMLPLDQPIQPKSTRSNPSCFLGSQCLGATSSSSSISVKVPEAEQEKSKHVTVEATSAIPAETSILSPSVSKEEFAAIKIQTAFRAYLLFPNLNKVVFLDDGIVVQRDLSPLWEINLEEKVNGAVETRRGEESWVMSKRFRKYFKFSHPVIAQSLDPR